MQVLGARIIRAIRSALAQVIVALFFSGAIVSGALAEPPEISAGRRLAQRDCGECHATSLSEPSRLPDAPPFRDLYKRFDVTHIGSALDHGLLVGHPRMPLVHLDSDEVGYLTAYLTSFIPPKREAEMVAKNAPQQARR